MGTHVIVGAGVLGGGLARRLAGSGHSVRLVSRSGSGPVHPSIERVAADATDGARLSQLTTGADALYNCANPAYWEWETAWPPLAASLLGAAEAAGAVLVAAGNLYGYGEVTAPMTEETPLAATSRKGKVRVRMWQDMLAAHEAGRARVVEVRASDYVGPGSLANAHLGERFIPRILAGKKGQLVAGNERSPHTWTYVPDFLDALAVAGTDERAWGRAWHVPSAPPRTPGQAASDIARLGGVADVGYQVFPRALLAVLGVGNKFFRELPEVRYQLDRPFVMDSSAWTGVFGTVATPWDDALLATIDDVRVTTSTAA